MSHLRVEIAQMSHASRIFFVANDGTETDMSSIVRNVEVFAKVGDVSTARLDVIKVVGHAHAELVGVLVKEVKPRSRWRRRLQEVTAFGHRERRYAA